MEIINNKQIYPYINNKCIKLLLKLDIKKHYNSFMNNLRKEKINAPSTYDEFVMKIKNDEKFKKTIKSHYENEDIKLISDSSYETLHIVELKNDNDFFINNYILNTYDMNYKDMFGNEIIFK